MPAAAAPEALASHLLGTLDVGADALFDFDAGLYGFPGARRFALVPAARDGLWWLQSAEDPALVFLLADPFHFFPAYAPDVPDAELAQLGGGGAPPADRVGVYAVVTLGTAGAPTASANLRAPVLLDTGAGRGRQVVLPADPHGITEPIALG